MLEGISPTVAVEKSNASMNASAGSRLRNNVVNVHSICESFIFLTRIPTFYSQGEATDFDHYFCGL